MRRMESWQIVCAKAITFSVYRSLARTCVYAINDPKFLTYRDTRDKNIFVKSLDCINKMGRRLFAFILAKVSKV